MSPLRFLLIALALGLPLGVQAQTWDVIIRHGLIVDGTGRAPYRGDVALQKDRIAQVGQVTGTALREIEATNLVVCPGFIDVHTHAEDVVNNPQAENFIRMGITTVIIGNCGASVVNVADYFRTLEAAHPALNVATLIGHNAVRREAMNGAANRAATPAEMERMKQLVDQAMADGAVGFSTGLIYIPGKFAPPSEITELARVCAARHGIYTTHVRNEQEGLLASIEEALSVGRDARVPVQISHLKTSGNLISPQDAATIRNLEVARTNHLAEKILTLLHQARQQGLIVTQDLYPYSATTGFIGRLLPSEMAAASPAKLESLLGDDTQRAAIAVQMEKSLRATGKTNYAHAVITTARRFKDLEGMNILEAAEKRRGANTLAAQIDLILSMARSGGASLIFYEMDEPELLPFLSDPQSMFASDSGTLQSETEMRHPRSYGNSAHALRRYVREEKRLSLEEAIRKMTSLPAATFHLKDRGELRPGAWADLVIFDPATVQDQSTYASPHICATGFQHVFVAGIEVVKSDRITSARPGKPVR